MRTQARKRAESDYSTLSLSNNHHTKTKKRPKFKKFVLSTQRQSPKNPYYAAAAAFLGTRAAAARERGENCLRDVAVHWRGEAQERMGKRENACVGESRRACREYDSFFFFSKIFLYNARLIIP